MPFRGRKGTNYEGGVREPCIMRWPGKIPAGSECREIAGNIDVLPTLAKISGARVSADNTLNGRTLDGRDITSLMFQQKAEPTRDVHLYFHGEQLQAIRKGDWKLIYAGAAQNAKNAKNPGKQANVGGKKNRKPVEPLGPELFNLADDPYETKNLAEAKPELVKELRTLAQEKGDEIRDHKRPAGKI
jgi:arylsulfatase